MSVCDESRETQKINFLTLWSSKKMIRCWLIFWVIQTNSTVVKVTVRLMLLWLPGESQRVRTKVSKSNRKNVKIFTSTKKIWVRWDCFLFFLCIHSVESVVTLGVYSSRTSGSSLHIYQALSCRPSPHNTLLFKFSFKWETPDGRIYILRVSISQQSGG